MLKTKIQEDIVAAMKTGNKEKLAVLRFLSSLIQNAEIEKGKQGLADEEIVRLISSQIKKLQESLKIFTEGKREDLAQKSKKEIEILTTYLPAQLNDEQLKKEIDKIISQNPNLARPGVLIGACLKALAGKADNRRIAQLVQQKLDQKS